MNCNQIH